MNLLSNAGTEALSSLQSSKSSILSTVSTKNTATGTYTGFNSSSIFSTSSGLSDSYGSSYSSSPYSGNTTGLENYWQLGNDGLNRRGAVDPYLTKLSAIPTSEKDYLKSDYGSSLSGNYCTSLQSVALGQYAPTSVFEQRLNYHLDYEDQRKPGQLSNSSSNYFNTDSVAYNTSNTSNYNVFGTYASTSTSASNSNTKSSTSVYSTDMSKYSSASNAQTVSSLMSLLA